MRTVGVDLSAEPKKTAVAVVDWADGCMRVDSINVGQTDHDIVDAAKTADKVGIDCPLGWPEPFIDFVTAHRDRGPLTAHDLAGRKSLAYRCTDLAVAEHEGLRPLSVSADRIGHAAMRAAGLLAAFVQQGHDVDRAGSGLVVEAYPAAALKRWHLPHRKYKGAGSSDDRVRLLGALLDKCGWLTIDSADQKECRRSDDALDAVICALIARAAALGKVTTPNDDQALKAATEGWIAVPTCDLGALLR